MKKVKIENGHEDVRKDFVKNKQTIIMAAKKLFEEKGPDVALLEIAQEANVSRMTFYRHFPDKSSLITAVFHYNLDRLSNYAKEHTNDPQCFFNLLIMSLNERIENNQLLPHVNEVGALSTMHKLIELFETPVKNAKKASLLRKDFILKEDLVILMMMLSGTIPYITVYGESKGAKRIFDFLIDGLRAPK